MSTTVGSPIDALFTARRAAEAVRDKRAGGRARIIFPDEGPYRRELYAKHLRFFEAGKTFKERLFMAANRVGKTRAGAFELRCHATGRYPQWWTGRTFAGPITAWACGTTSETTRDIVQYELLGPWDQPPGQGMLDADAIAHTSRRPHGLPGSIETVWVRHISGGMSQIGLKTYEQGRKSFEGTAKHIIWDDEEPPEDVYTEQLYRTATTRGIVFITFTPLQGMSSVVKGFLLPEKPDAKEFKWFIQAGWRDVPHVPLEEQTALLATTPPHQVKARTEGEPSLGSGAIYPIATEDIAVKRFDIPKHWPRGWAADHGWNWFGAIWVSLDRDTNTSYLYDCYKRSQAEPPIHFQAIQTKSKGLWMPGVMDAADINKIDGRQFVKMYQDMGLDVTLPQKAVEAGIQEVWTRLSTGRLKVFADLEPWFEEFRLYHRDEKGQIVKINDHLLDPTRYQVMAPVLDRMKVPPIDGPVLPTAQPYALGSGQSTAWMR